ncbi:hypothetical protein AQUCO_01600213v1 [Aquilegia coerulea]|uniref:Uncharacterized protein n=1 Tax=Aquilegia coerulea TaxID=218851 RepID=A0A2G5DQP7_AQUCA|nr:hypothetical protein AQUCO_01600213v1 [Aquilegia coerulea]PIA45818.1 hypothetical protein AQUCO_01600213v1 [Aquilegia coerulea]
MDSKHTAEMYKHLEKQSEVLWEAYRSMSHELRSLRVEEEMLMHKFYEVMTAQGYTKKNKNEEDTSKDDGNLQSSALVVEQSNLK